MNYYQIEHRCLVRPNGLTIGGFDKVNDEFADRVLAELNTLQAELNEAHQRVADLEATIKAVELAIEDEDNRGYRIAHIERVLAGHHATYNTTD